VCDGVAYNCKCSYKDCVIKLLLTASVSGGVACKCSCEECIARLLPITSVVV
jgi:hypothetical protein